MKTTIFSFTLIKVAGDKSYFESKNSTLLFKTAKVYFIKLY